jgi:hypothetical protein
VKFVPRSSNVTYVFGSARASRVWHRKIDTAAQGLLHPEDHGAQTYVSVGLRGA